MLRKMAPSGGLGVVATLGALGCGEPTGVPRARADVHSLSATTRVTGIGATLPPGERMEFDFDVTDAPGGRMVITWYSSYPPPDGVERLTVEASDPATRIQSFNRTSAACVRFSGTGRLDIDGSLKIFYVDACDNGQPGTGLDTFGIDIPSDNWQRADPLSEGEIVIGGGVPPPPPPPPPETTRITGLGATLPPGERMEFDFDVTNAPGGRMRITWYAAYPPSDGAEYLTVDPSDSATRIQSFNRTSAACVQFSGTGRLDISRELRVFSIDACDNAHPGTGFDTFAINVPADNWQRADPLSEGEIVVGRF
jgi:hypothetical protein